MSSSSEHPPLEEMTLRQLRRVASELGISRYSRMRKEQMLNIILEIQQRNQQNPLSQPVSSPARTLEVQTEVEAAKFDVGQDDRTGGTLATVDEMLPDLPDGYGDRRIVLLPRDPQWAYAYWDISNEIKELVRRQGGVRLALRFYDVTDLDLNLQRPHSLQQYECDELAREWYLPVPVSDRDYMIEIGYLTVSGTWLVLARSSSVRIPPIYPSDWIDDQLLTIEWDEELRGKTFFKLIQTTKQLEVATDQAHQEVFALAESAEAQRMAGSVFGSMQQVPEEAVSSYVLPSGAGEWASGAGVSGMSGVGVTGMSGAASANLSGVGMMSGASAVGMSGVGMMSGVGLGVAGMSGVGMSGVGMSGVGMSGVGMYTTSGVGMMSGAGLGVAGMSGVGMMSGIGMYTTSGAGMMSGVGMSGVGMYTMSGIGMSGVGFSASAPPIRPRQFWLVADAELIVYGATEPDATVTIGGRPIKLNADGTFRFQMSFQDGKLDFPIMAVAADGVQNRSVHLKFERETPERRTNTKEEAVQEWLS
jgi:uncharacterized protein